MFGSRTLLPVLLLMMESLLMYCASMPWQLMMMHMRCLMLSLSSVRTGVLVWVLMDYMCAQRTCVLVCAESCASHLVSRVWCDVMALLSRMGSVVCMCEQEWRWVHVWECTVCDRGVERLKMARLCSCQLHTPFVLYDRRERIFSVIFVRACTSLRLFDSPVGIRLCPTWSNADNTHRNTMNRTHGRTYKQNR